MNARETRNASTSPIRVTPPLTDSERLWHGGTRLARTPAKISEVAGHALYTKDIYVLLTPSGIRFPVVAFVLPPRFGVH